MANPFSAVPTAYRVLADDRWWYANCAWDAFSICAPSEATAPSKPRAPTAIELTGTFWQLAGDRAFPR